MSGCAFANILLSGPCNLACPPCIGSQVPTGLKVSNLDRWPLLGLGRFTRCLLQLGIREVSLTGTDTEPLLYQHHPQLLAHLRATLPNVRVSLHTNGTLVLNRPRVFNLYDRATISVPSFCPQTCRAMTGSATVLDLAAILAVSNIPIKVSTLVTADNCREVPEILGRCHQVGIQRAVLRRPWQHQGSFNPLADRSPCGSFGGNPVYDVDGMQVTVWDFREARVACVNLFADGTLTTDYQLARRGHV
jgi:MoaA/NifB/PqqE/SkfB family radical SAM enzyme